MPRRERNWEIRRRRKRKEERRKLRAKGLITEPAGTAKESGKKKPEKPTLKEARKEGAEEPVSEG
jgi:hypothetical protein